jgi:hypothetical protein
MKDEGYPDAKQANMMADVERQDPFDRNRANICIACRYLKITPRTPEHLYQNRPVCTCKPSAWQCPVCLVHFPLNAHGFAVSCNCTKGE